MQPPVDGLSDHEAHPAALDAPSGAAVLAMLEEDGNTVRLPPERIERHSPAWEALPAEEQAAMLAHEERNAQREAAALKQRLAGEIDGETHAARGMAIDAARVRLTPRDLYPDDPRLARVECEYRRLRGYAVVVGLPRHSTRPRGAGRPACKGASRRSSARSGDSGEEPEPEEPAPARLALAPPVLAFGCLSAEERGAEVEAIP